MKHEFKAIPKEEILANRSSAYEFIDFDKQETLYKAFLNCLINKEFKTKEDYIAFKGAEFGAKWQQEQDKKFFSLDDLKEAFAMGRTNATIKDFNTKFKKK